MFPQSTSLPTPLKISLLPNYKDALDAIRSVTTLHVQLASERGDEIVKSVLRLGPGWTIWGSNRGGNKFSSTTPDRPAVNCVLRSLTRGVKRLAFRISFLIPFNLGDR
jgi:hypothetical protein